MISAIYLTVTLAFAQAALVSTAAATAPAVSAAELVAPASGAERKADVEASPSGSGSATDSDMLRDGAIKVPLPSEPAPAPTAALGNLSDRQVADAVTVYLEGLTTLEGEFVQTAPSGAVSTGRIYLRRPGQIRFDYDAPSPLTIVATQGMVYVQDEALDQTDAYPLKKTPLKFLLSKKIDLSDARLVGVDRWENAVAVTYASSDEEAEGELTLALAAPELAIDQWAVRDAQNGLTVIQLKNLSAGGKLDNRLFRAPDAGGAFINN